MKITQDTHDQFYRVVADNPGITNNELAALIFTDNNAGRISVSKYKKAMIKSGVYEWEGMRGTLMRWFIKGAKPLVSVVRTSFVVPNPSPQDAPNIDAAARIKAIDNLMNRGLAAR